MIQILITDISIKEKILCNKPHNITVINSTEPETAINQIKRLTRGPIEIYDYTFNPQHNHDERIIISDHINKTGHNPLIGNQDKIRKQFIDISSLYKTKDGVTTRCLGKRFNTQKKENKYPGFSFAFSYGHPMPSAKLPGGGRGTIYLSGMTNY